jgi:hypothetical protein
LGKCRKKGRIINGMSPGWFVLVEDESTNTGGFLILIAKNIDLTLGFDNWVENRDSLEQFWQEAGWEIEWLE